MKFKDWLAKSGVKMSQIARDLRVTGTTIQKINYGRYVGKATAAKISAYTKGEVSIEELMNSAPKRRKRTECPTCGARTLRV